MPLLEVLLHVRLTDGQWQTMPLSAGRICFDVTNDSSYVLRDLTIRVSLEPKPPDFPDGGEPVILRRQSDFSGHDQLLDVGKTLQLCGTAPTEYPSGAKWSYNVSAIMGWKR